MCFWLPFFSSQLIHFPVFVSVFLHHFKCALSDLTSYLHWFLTVAEDSDRAPAVCLTTTAWFCLEESCLFCCTAACRRLCCSLVLVSPAPFLRCRVRTACCCSSQPGRSQRSSATPSTPSASSITCHTSSNGQGRSCWLTCPVSPTDV